MISLRIQNMGRMNVNLDNDQHKKFRLWCIENDTTMSETIRKWIEKEIKANEKS